MGISSFVKYPRDIIHTILKTQGISEDHIVTIVREDPDVLEALPNYLCTERVISEAVQVKGDALQYIRDRRLPISKNNAILAVQQNGNALRFVPLESFNNNDMHEIQIEACTQTWTALQYCIEVLIDEVNAAFPPTGV